MPKPRNTEAPRLERDRVLARERKRRQRDRGGSVTRRSTSAVTATTSSRRRGGTDANAERRVASRGKRDKYAARAWGGHLENDDPTLLKFSKGRGIVFYKLLLHQFANVAGYCQGWVDHVLISEPTIKAAKAANPEDQTTAEEAAVRALRAWKQVRNRSIVLQKLLFGRFFGFARAEKVARYDDVIGEWIPDVYDVPQEAWLFDDDGREFLIDAEHPTGFEIDPRKFIHFQWGSADTKYGEGALSPVYLALWKIQKLETMALQRIEDNESTVIVHVPEGIVGPDRANLEAAYAGEFRKVIIVPSKEPKVYTEMPTLGVTTSGAAGRPEYEGIRFYERWIQTHLLGAPQTGDKSMGTGKLEDTRKDVWDDKTPLGRGALDQCLTEGWISTYCDWNMADLPRALRPRFESDAPEISEGLSGAAATEARLTGLDLAASRLTTTFAVEQWSGLGYSKPRAQAIADSFVAERASLVVAPPTGAEAPPAAVPATPDPERQEAAA